MTCKCWSPVLVLVETKKTWERYSETGNRKGHFNISSGAIQQQKRLKRMQVHKSTEIKTKQWTGLRLTLDMLYTGFGLSSLELLLVPLPLYEAMIAAGPIACLSKLFGFCVEDSRVLLITTTELDDIDDVKGTETASISISEVLTIYFDYQIQGQSLLRCV